MKSNLIMLCLLGLASTLNAQDPRERHYYYEILDPRHEPKPLVEGFTRERVTENLNRGLTVTPARDGKGIYLSWRLLASDAPGTAFHVYREADGKARRLTKKPLTQTCDFMDVTPAEKASYWVEVLVKGKKSALSEKREVILSELKPYTSIPLKESVKAGKIALADLNGDGIYDYIIRTPETNVDPGMPGDTTGKTYKISAYLSDGSYLWTYDMGPGIEPGIWYSPFIVYDFNGDGKAEVAIKTAADDYVKNEKGRVCGGSEYLSVLDGMTGKEIDRVDWPERNDRYGNLIRQNRNQMGVAYLDGKTPAFYATVTGGQYDTNWLYDAGYIRIKNITLGYNIPFKPNSVLSKARIYVSCDNVYMWDHYDAGFSPEAATQDNASSDWGAYPLSRTFSFGVNVTF